MGIEPKLGTDYDLKSMFPRIKTMLETFVAYQIVAFEKEHIDIPMTEIPNYIPRYDDILKINNTVSKST